MRPDIRTPFTLPAPDTNDLLASLSAEDFSRLEPCLVPTYMKAGDAALESTDSYDAIHFPVTAIVALVNHLASGHALEIAIVGHDGVVGVSSYLGAESTSTRSVVQREGWTYRLKASLMRREFSRGGSLQRTLLRYADSLLSQTAQIAVCTRHHTIDEQFCRWLLMNLDVRGDEELTVTQEQVAHLLGVRRESIAEAAGRLQASGIIHHSRGHVSVIDRPRLEQISCECYAAIRNARAAALPRPHRPAIPAPIRA